MVVAVDPSYFNNNQQIAQKISFWCLRLLWFAGWLCNKPQPDALN